LDIKYQQQSTARKSTIIISAKTAKSKHNISRNVRSQVGSEVERKRTINALPIANQ
jgi:hypothetical protein